MAKSLQIIAIKLFKPWDLLMLALPFKEIAAVIEFLFYTSMISWRHMAVFLLPMLRGNGRDRSLKALKSISHVLRFRRSHDT